MVQGNNDTEVHVLMDIALNKKNNNNGSNEKQSNRN